MKRTWKRIVALVLAGTLAMGLGVTAFADEAVLSSNDKPFISLGADLTADQRATVLSLFGLTEADLANYDVVTVTNAQEHEYLDAYIPSSTIGTKALSSVVVWEASRGDGITVTTKNITYCTSGMYSNALATAGVTDANVIVAGPSAISGTAALIGAIEAYSVMTGTEIDSDIIDGAIDEIVTTGELEESIGSDSSDEVEGLVAYMKDNMDDVKDMTDEELDAEIVSVAAEFGLYLDDDEIVQIRELLRKLQNLNLDWDSISAQANALFDKLGNSGLDLSSLGISDSSGFVQSVRNVANRVIDFFRGLFNRN